MSIATRTGDNGTTGLMYNRRVSKSHPRVESYGTVDELNSALGMARATASHDFVRTFLLKTQQDLVILMGELATLPEDLGRYSKDGFSTVDTAMTSRLDEAVKTVEAQNVSFKGWATPGATLHAAALDVARTTCRRAERRVSVLQEAGELGNTEIVVYLNRLSDSLWLMARWVEHQLGLESPDRGPATRHD